MSAKQLPLFQERLDVVAAPVSQERLIDPAPSSRDKERSRRKRDVRARSIAVKRIPKRELAHGRMLYPPEEHEDVKRPKTRADCKDGFRPCPFVSCKHHLYLDVSAKTGAIKLNFPDLEPWELPQTCALDVSDRGAGTLEGVGEIMNLTRERIRQVEVKALAKLEATKQMFELRDHYGPVGPKSKRKLPVIVDDVREGDDLDPDEFASSDLDED